jgi:uncharacterized membrane protein
MTGSFARGLIAGATGTTARGAVTYLDIALRGRPAGAGLTLRAAALGLATGGRSSLGLAAPTLTSPVAGPAKKLAALAALAGELVIDKLPGTPPRTTAGPLTARLAMGAAGAGLLAGREEAGAGLPVAAGIAGAAAGSFGGLAWRRWASSRMPDRQAALIEDGAWLLLAAVACRPDRQRTARPAPAVVPR